MQALKIHCHSKYWKGAALRYLEGKVKSSSVEHPSGNSVCTHLKGVETGEVAERVAAWERCEGESKKHWCASLLRNCSCTMLEDQSDRLHTNLNYKKPRRQHKAQCVLYLCAIGEEIPCEIQMTRGTTNVTDCPQLPKARGSRASASPGM